MDRHQSNAEDDLRRAEDTLVEAMKRSDVAALDSLLADDLLFIAPDGSRLDKRSDLEAHRSGTTRFMEITPLRQTVAVEGLGGATSLVANIVVIDHGHRIEARVRYERHWRQGEQGWQVVSGSVKPDEGAA